MPASHRKRFVISLRLRRLWLLALFAAPVLIVSLTQDIGATAHDAAAEHILRGVAFSAAIDDGVLYPRWSQALHWGLGSPLFTFQPPLPYYALDLLHRLGLPHDLGWRWLVAAGFGLAFVGAYLLVRELTGRRWPALTAASAYLYAPYILRNALERGSNEAYSVFLYPLVLWSLLRLARPASHAVAGGAGDERLLAPNRGFSRSAAQGKRPADSKEGLRTASIPAARGGALTAEPAPQGAHEGTRVGASAFTRARPRPDLRSVGRFLLATLAWAACIGSHVLGPLMLAPFAGLLALFLGWRRRTAAPLLALLAGGLLTAFIWAPMIPEQAWVHVERDFIQPEAIPADNPLPLADLLAPPAIYDTGRANNNMGDRVGLGQTILLGVAAAAALVALASRRGDRRVTATLLVAALAGLFLFWLLTGWSDWLWRLGGDVMARLLYRTRLMGVQALAAATAIGLLIALAPARWQRLAALFAGGGLLLAALPSLYPQYQHAYTLSTPPYNLADVRAMEIRHHGTALTAFGEFTPRARTATFDQVLLDDLGAGFDAGAQPLASPDAGLQVLAAQVRDQAWDLDLIAAQPITATLHLLYYPRWRAWLDDRPIPLTAQADTGYAQAAVPAGEHRLMLRYGATPFESAGLVLSGLTALALLGVTLIGAQPLRGLFILRRRPPIPEPREPAPEPWVLLGLTVLLALKVAVLDPHTTAFRAASTCDAIREADVQTDVTFGGRIRLCGYDLPRASLRPGDWLTITLYWQVDAPFDLPAHSFAHLLGPFNPATGNPLWGQHDKTAPAGFTMLEWQPDKLYWDRYRLQVDPSTQPGAYQLEIGWWQTGLEQRLVPAIAADAGPLSVSPYESLLIDGIVIR